VTTILNLALKKVVVLSTCDFEFLIKCQGLPSVHRYIC
jgi:hypothetical protein